MLEFPPGKNLTTSLYPNELKFKIFGKKNCLMCGNNLFPNIKYFYTGRRRTSGGSNDVGIYDCYKGLQYYYCDCCDVNFTIQELIGKDVVNKPDAFSQGMPRSAATRYFDPECDNGTLYLLPNSLLYICDGIDAASYKFEIPFVEIESISPWQIRGFANGLSIKPKEGQYEHFIVYNRKIWVQKLKQAVIFYRRPAHDGANGANDGAKICDIDTEFRIDLLILQAIQTDPRISATELSNAVNKSRRTIQRKLETLKNKGLIERIGPTNGGEWQITEAGKQAIEVNPL